MRVGRFMHLIPTTEVANFASTYIIGIIGFWNHGEHLTSREIYLVAAGLRSLCLLHQWLSVPDKSLRNLFPNKRLTMQKGIGLQLSSESSWWPPCPTHLICLFFVSKTHVSDRSVCTILSIERSTYLEFTTTEGSSSRPCHLLGLNQKDISSSLPSCEIICLLVCTY